MFEDYQQYRDWKKLQVAIDEADSVTPCTNFPDAWYPDNHSLSSEGRVAKKMCRTSCPVVRECAIYGIKWETVGIWGGLTPDERLGIRRGRPVIKQRGRIN